MAQNMKEILEELNLHALIPQFERERERERERIDLNVFQSLNDTQFSRLSLTHIAATGNSCLDWSISKNLLL